MQLAELLEAGAAPDRRGRPRRQIRLVTNCSLPAQAGQRILIADISEEGMRIKTQARLPIGEEIEFCLPDIPPVSGEVTWQRDIDHGIRFTSPLSAASLAAALLASPAEVPPAEVPPAEVPPAATGAETRSPQARNDTGASSCDEPAKPELRDRDLVWILPLFGLMQVWFAIVDAVFAVGDGIARRR